MPTGSGQAPPTSTLTVDTVSPELREEWDAFVRGCESWTPYHLYGWRDVIGSVHDHPCHYLGARRADGALCGILPLVHVRSRLFGNFLVSVPFLNYGGPLGDVDAVRALTDAAVGLADLHRVHLLELRSPTPLPVDLDVSHRKITVILDLPVGDPAAVWKGLDSKVRSQVRRPMKEGVDVRFGSAQLDPFYAVFARHMRDLGTPVQPRRLFETALDTFGEMMWFGCAYLRGHPVAAGCGFRWADRFELVWASSLREHNRIAPNMLLYWRFIERGVHDGAAIFDFGRCTPRSGTHRFKAQWGGSDQALWWYQHGPRAGGGTPSPDAGVFSLGPKVWSRLPLALANALGPRIVRYVP
jgi:FemAB-related protein (PEP-CTERM system-associated)